MSDVVAPAPPPPPPPPPPSAPAAPTFDFVKPLTYVFDDPQWIQKMLLGALFSLASIILIGIFIVYGYMARLVRQVIEGVERPLPDWNNVGDYIGEGVKLFIATLLYGAPVFILIVLTIPFSIISDASNLDDAARFAGGAMSAGLGCLIGPLALMMAIWVPAALLRAMATGEFSAAFDFAAIAAFLKNNAINYLLAYVVWILARFVAGFGLLLCCVGVFVTAFWSMCVGAYAFAQTWRLASVK
jgi:hypothetical protein